ncbi:MAG: hypothetical protein ABSE93_25420 [Terriglobia bacterium]|jgi:hypothetical protein
MTDIPSNETVRGGALVPVIGKLPPLSSKNLNRLAVFLVQGNKVLSETPVKANGTFQLHVVPQLARDPSVYAVLGPKGLDPQSLAAHADLPRLSLASARGHEKGAVSLDFAELNIDDEFIDIWWIWCREYTVSGALDTSANCPVPGAQVTVYNVTTGVSGLVATPIVTVPTDPSGNFSASFNWCSRLCLWPCWPWWWRCWPWWWELDILAVIENIERQLQVKASAPSVKLQFPNVAPLRQPDGADLITGQGFASARAGTALKPDAARTALIASKFADVRIREYFPWWWWCCDNPNILFSATQGANTILDEDPNTSTRWCFDSGQSVTLVGNNLSIGACPITEVPEGFTWTSVGGGPPTQVLVPDITLGYANGTAGNDASNMAFAGTLNLYGAIGSNIAFYQVLAGQWDGNGNPARGGTAPVTSQPLGFSAQLISNVSIYRGATMTVETDAVILGPCSFNGNDHLYMTQNQRPNAPAAVTAQIGAFPTVNTGAGDFIIGWSDIGLVLSAPASALIGGAPTGGVSLSIAAYDISGNPVSLVTDIPLTLMIDTTGFTPTIDSYAVYNGDGTPATETPASSLVCPSYQITPGGYVLLHVTVDDPNGHLFQYQIETQYGNGSLAAPTTNPLYRGYAQNPSTFTPPSPPTQLYGVDAGYGVPNAQPPVAPPPTPAPTNWTFVGGGDTIQIMIPQSCCYDFQLWAGKRITDGTTFVCTWGNPAYQTVNITVVVPPAS